jgi:DNA repair exonuclease SbcCD nuclease subunit
MSVQPVAIVAADLHLTKATWKKHPTLAGDTYRALIYLVDSAISRKLPLWLLGDIFDSQRPDSETVAIFCDAMDRARHFDVQVLFIQGNHDKADPPWPRVHPWPRWMHQQTFNPLPSLKCYALDYTPRDKLPEELSKIPPGTDILLAHQSWEELQTIGATDGSLLTVPTVRVVLTGDYHVRLTKWMHRLDGTPLVVHSPGSTSMQALNERWQKQATVLLLNTDDGQLITENIDLPSRMFVDLYVRNATDLQQAITGLEAIPTLPDAEKPILRLRFNDSLADAYDVLMARHAERFHVFAEPQHAEVENVPVDTTQTGTPATNFDTLDSGLVAMLAQGAVDQGTYDVALRLLRTNPTVLANEPQQIFNDLKAAVAATIPPV